MAASNGKFYGIFLMVLCSTFLLVSGGWAKLPAPDSIIYGSVRVDGVVEESATVTLKLTGADDPIASYEVGANPQAKNLYLLRIPMSMTELVPPLPDTAKEGDDAEIFIDGNRAAGVTIGKPGSIQLKHLDTDPNDSDNDGLSDSAEDVESTNKWNSDSDGDGLSDARETATGSDPLLHDTDGDGFSDGYERLTRTDPLEEDSIPVVYVDAGNDTGFEDGTAIAPYNTITEGIDAAHHYYTVNVNSGVYAESLTLDKDVRLVGESPTDTIIDAGGDAYGIQYDFEADQNSWIAGFTIRNADVGIECAVGASPLIRNNILTRLSTSGIYCEADSTVRIINNTIAANPNAVAVESESDQITLVNNIISNNYAGIDREGPGLRIDYNDLWQNTGDGDYVGTTLQGDNDTNSDPLFASVTTGDFRLLNGSQCLDAGDPVERLTEDYTDGSTLTVNAVTNIMPGDRIWITDGTNLETDIVAAVTTDTIDIRGKLLNDYLVSNNSYIFTDTSNSVNEPSPHNVRIDMGAYGNTPEAEPLASLCPGDFEPDGDVDAADLAKIAAHHGRTDCTQSDPCFGDFDDSGTVDDSDMATFASDFGSTDCLEDN